MLHQKQQLNEGKTAINVLVLGGNGMMGSDFIYLIKTNLQHKYGDKYQFNITTLNRGNHYWDSEERVDPLIVDKITCDRKKIKKYGPKIFLNSRHTYDYVIDFSGYKRKYVKYMIKNGPNIKQMYIFISTDSVYEVCKPIRRHPILEESAVRPEDEKERKILNEKDDYGNDKLKCEEYLISSTSSMIQLNGQHMPCNSNGNGNNNDNYNVINTDSSGNFGDDRITKKADFKYLILRLPDVVGARDNTDRTFNYFLWLRTHKDIGIPLHLAREEMKLSFVYSETVASVICESIEINLLNSNKSFDGDTKCRIENKVFNIIDGDDNGMTLKAFLTTMGKAMGIDNVQFVSSKEKEMDDSDDINTYYPSTTRGPISSERAQKYFKNYKPNDLYKVMFKAVQFYDNIMKLWVNGSCNKTVKDQIDEIVYDDLVDELNMNDTQKQMFVESLRRYYKNT